MWWRAGLLAFGLAFTAMAGLCGWLLANLPGDPLGHVLAAMHSCLFGAVGIVMTMTAIRSSDETVRTSLTSFLGDVFGRRNLREIAVWACVIAVAVSVMVAVRRLRG